MGRPGTRNPTGCGVSRRRAISLPVDLEEAGHRSNQREVGDVEGPDRGATRGGGDNTSTTTRGRFGRSLAPPLPPEWREGSHFRQLGGAQAGSAGPPRVR